MSRSVYDEQDSSRENTGTQSTFAAEQESMGTGTPAQEAGHAGWVESSGKTDGISKEAERIASLSSEMTGLLSGMQQKVNASVDQYKSLESAVDEKKEELRRLYDIEDSAALLSSLVEFHRSENERFEILMKNRHDLWKSETEQRIQEEKEYLEALQFRRDQEEEEYRRMWATEKDRAREALKEELEALQKEFKKKQEEIENYFLQREAILKAKEKECDEIIREMERFISGLGKRVQDRVDAAVHLSTEELLAQSSFEDEIIGGNGSPMSVEEKDALMEASKAEDSGSEATEVASAQNSDSVTIM